MNQSFELVLFFSRNVILESMKHFTSLIIVEDFMKLEEKLLTYREVAEVLRCSERTVQSRVKNGDIKPLYNGRLVLFTEECIHEFLYTKTPNKQMELQQVDPVLN